MKKLLLVFTILAHTCYAQYDNTTRYYTAIQRADAFYRDRDYPAASKAFSEAFLLTQEIRPFHLYNGACAAALAGEKDTAFSRLFRRLEVDPGWYSNNIRNDNDLKSLHSNPRWSILLDSLDIRRARIEKNYDKPLRARLLGIIRKDQDIRFKYLDACRAIPQDTVQINALAKEMRRTDSLNLEEIRGILDTSGWVGKEKVGDACDAFFLVVQHSSLEIQKKYYPLLKKAALRGDISLLKLAMLEDRIAVGEGRPQKYGSQSIKDRDGYYRIAPLLDTSRVEEWRKEVGMKPLNLPLK